MDNPIIQLELNTINQLQTWVHHQYNTLDDARGLDGTFMLFMEEVGELATALYKKDTENIQEEIGDVLMWLTSLANLSGVQLQDSIDEYVRRNANRASKE